MKDQFKKPFLLFLFSVFLLLLIVLAYQGESKKAKMRSFDISVLVQSPSDRFKKGIDKAALDYNVDVHLIVTGEDTYKQQEAYLLRELENNADAVVLQSQNPESMLQFLNECNPRVPIVTYEQELKQRNVAAYVGIDQYALGVYMGELVASAAQDRACMIISSVESELLRARIAGLYSVMLDKGIPCYSLYTTQDKIGEDLQGYAPLTLVSFETGLLPPLCEQARKEDLLFGAGYTNAIRTQLESGRLHSLVIYSEFDMGYLSLRAAALVALGESAPKLAYRFHTANGRNMYEAPIEQILFPIN